MSNEFSDVGVVAVDEHVPSAGAIVWWRLSGEVDYAAIQQAWKEEGLDEKDLVSSCSPVTALRRAVDTLRQKRRLVRPLGRGNGFALVKERIVNEKRELDHDVLVTIKFDTAGRIVVDGMEGVPTATVDEIRAKVNAAFTHALNTLDTEDFSCWLVRMMPKLDAVGLRDTGGIYFVPRQAVERVRAVARVLRKVSSHVVNRVPAMHGDDAVEAILDAITQEAEGEASRLERDLEEMKLGEKGFENRVAHCDAVESKVTRYEELLGRKLDDVREKLEALRARLTVATLKTNASDTNGASDQMSLAGL